VALAVGVGVGVAEAERVVVPLALGVGAALGVPLAEVLGEAPTGRLPVGMGVTLGVREAERVAVVEGVEEDEGHRERVACAAAKELLGKRVGERVGEVE
jgi:hypothetical protein